MTDLSIVLVNWNSLTFAEQCIESICSTVHGLDYEVIVVDNASADAPCQSLMDRFPAVKLILSGTNIGFGRANNLGVRQSTGRVLFFLNPDTVLRGDAVQRMLDELARRPQAGAVGCRLLNPDFSLQTSSVQRFPTVLNQLLALGMLQRLLPGLPLWGKQSLYSARGTSIHRVDVVSGAGIMVRRDVFEEVGGFNPEYFMFAEEVDLCFAIRKAGREVLHCSEAEVIHFGGQSTSQREDGFAEVAMRDSVYRFFLRTRGGRYAFLFRAGLLLSASFRLLLLTVIMPAAVAFNRPLSGNCAKKIWRKWQRIGKWALRAGHTNGRVEGASMGSSAAIEERG